jgi:hypothetical protein
MSHEIKPVLVESSIIADLTSEMVFPVVSGPANYTLQPFPFNSQSNSSLVANIQIPSESIVFDSKVLFQSDLHLTFTLANVPIGAQVFAYGQSDSLNSYPLQSLFSTCNLVLNNSASSTNYADVLAIVKILEDKNYLDKSDSFSPNYVNQMWGRYSDAVLTNSNPMASYNETTLNGADRIPNGAFPYSYFQVNHYIAGILTDDSLISTSTSDTWTIYMSFAKLTEPFLCISPFTNQEWSSGLMGINNLALTLNINQCQKVWATGNSYVNSAGTGLSSYITNITLGNPQSNNLGFTNAKLLFSMTTMTDLQFSRKSVRSVSNFVDYPRYISASSNSPLIAPGGTGVVQFQNIQISQVPSLLVIALRVPLSQQNWDYTDSFMPISQISITFNNASGLLASANASQLYKISLESGSTQSFYSFGGKATAIQNGQSVIVPTLGSIIVINPAEFLSLNELLSNSSIGQFNLQITATCSNNQAFSIAPEGIILTINHGVAICELGQCSYFTALLDRTQVLETKSTTDENRIVDADFYRNVVGGKMYKASIGKFLKSTKGKMNQSDEGGKKHMSKSKLHKLLR